MTEEQFKSGYRALWHAETQRVTGYVSERETSAPLVNGPAYYQSAIQHVHYDLDTFDKVQRDLVRVWQRGEPATIMFSINFKSFCAPEFNDEYLPALRRTPANLLTYLLPRFVRIPPAAPHTLIAAKAEMLSSIFGRVVLQVPLEGDLHRFAAAPCTMLATSVKEAQRVARLPVVGQQSIEPLLYSFVELAKSMKCEALITGVDTQDALVAAMQARADFASGAVVGPLAQMPGSQFNLSADEICAPPRRKTAAPAA